MSNQVSFEKFDVQCGDRVEKAHESQRKLVQMEIEGHKAAVEENRRVGSFSRSLNQQGLMKSLVCRWMQVLL